MNSGAFSLVIALALASISVEVRKRRCALEADGLILDDRIDDCHRCSWIFIGHCDAQGVSTTFQVIHSKSMNLELGVASESGSTIHSC